MVVRAGVDGHTPARRSRVHGSEATRSRSQPSSRAVAAAAVAVLGPLALLAVGTNVKELPALRIKGKSEPVTAYILGEVPG